MARAARTLVTRETRSRLVDKRGLAKDSAPVVSRVDKQDVAFEQRRRLLSFWRLSSTGSATLHMHERTSCHGDFLAVDASQSLLHMRALETPMGSYPRVTVRASDVTFVQFHSRWRISPALPALPRSLLRRCSTDTQVGCQAGEPSSTTVTLFQPGHFCPGTPLHEPGHLFAPKVSSCSKCYLNQFC